MTPFADIEAHRILRDRILFQFSSTKERLNACLLSNLLVDSTNIAVQTQPHRKRKCPTEEDPCTVEKRCSPGCKRGFEDRVTDDLHTLTWLQRDNLLSIKSLEEDDDFVEEDVGGYQFTLEQLAFLAIEATQTKSSTFSEIVAWCEKNTQNALTKDSKWKLRLRHVLSMSPAFKLLVQKIIFSDEVSSNFGLWVLFVNCCFN